MLIDQLKQTLDLGLQLHQSGRLVEAETHYRTVLTAWPTHADALHLLGLIFHQTARPEQALQSIIRAVSLNPRAAEYYNSLTAVYIALKQPDAAIAAGRRAVELQPSLPEAWCNLGNALYETKQCDQAIESYSRALGLRSTYAQAFMGLGNALADKTQLSEAATAYRRAIELRPNLNDAHYNLGNTLRLLEHHADAVACYRQAVALKPDHLEAINNLACTLQQMGHLNEALQCLQNARAAHPHKARVHSNLANVLAEADRWDEAIVGYLDALEVQSDYHDARFNLALARLMTGDFERGWVDYEARWKCESFPSPLRYMQRPMWRGEPLEGKRILLHTEQGLGDTLQFARYVPMVADRGGTVIFQVQPQLRRLLQHTPGAKVVAHDLTADEFDVQCPLWSLPMVLGTRLDTIPLITPCLFIDPAQQSHWRARLAAIHRADHRLNVGLIWSGSPNFAHNYRRSTKLQKLAPLAQVPGINFISLQKGPAAEQAKHPPTDMQLFDWTDGLNDFADTAALISQLDLTISTDTGVAHLAGLMGKPTWILLMFAPDFRWLRQRDDSPWYPSVKLFRQPVAGDWETPVSYIKAELSNTTKP